MKFEGCARRASPPNCTNHPLSGHRRVRESAFPLPFNASHGGPSECIIIVIVIVVVMIMVTMTIMTVMIIMITMITGIVMIMFIGIIPAMSAESPFALEGKDHPC